MLIFRGVDTNDHLGKKNNIQSSDAAMIGLRRDLSMRGQLIEPRSLQVEKLSSLSYLNIPTANVKLYDSMP